MEKHPWITFDLRLNLSAGDWMNFGEARSKCKHLSGVPIKPEVAAELASVTLMKGALATTAIEGNTITATELKEHLSGHSKIARSR